MKNIFTKPLFAPLFVYIVWSFWVVVTLTFFNTDLATIYGDNGFTDIATYVFYGGVLLALTIFVRDFYSTGKMLDFCAFAALTVICILREMGAQHWLPSKDTTFIKIRFFTNPDNPISEKILGAFIIIAIVVVIGYILYKYAVPVVKGFFRLNPISWGIATLGTFGLIGKVIDRMHSKFFVNMGSVELSTGFLEETLEAMIPFSAIVVILQFHYMLKTSKEDK